MTDLQRMVLAFAIGAAFAFRAGYIEGIDAERAAAFERSDCACSSRCCETHDTRP